MADRETVTAALFAKLQGAYAWGKFTRRMFAPEQMASPGSPGAALIKSRELHRSHHLNMPSQLTLKFALAIYVDCSSNANLIPDQQLNAILAAVEAAMAPDTSGFLTLGGAAYSVNMLGESVFMLGAATGKGGVIKPIEVLVP